jgi:hypothetical protein
MKILENKHHKDDDMKTEKLFSLKMESLSSKNDC